MKKSLYIIVFSTLLSACSGKSAFQTMQALMGYIPPLVETTVGEELKQEFSRCEKQDPNRNCAQIAFDMVRTVKGLEPRKVPKGVVIILEGNVKMENESSQNKSLPEDKEN